MIRVALVEDEESSQRTLTEYLERFSQEINEKIHVSIFPDGAEIVEDYRGNYDIILMDILMRYMDGMEAASERFARWTRRSLSSLLPARRSTS